MGHGLGLCAGVCVCVCAYAEKLEATCQRSKNELKSEAGNNGVI